MPSNKPGSRLIKAAGGVAWRPGPDGSPQVLLVHRKKYDDWSLPKGKAEPGEPLPVTAVREVLEEGGARLALGRRLASVRYNVGGRPKRVHYWSARVLSVDARAIPNAEVDEVAWVPAEHAAERASYPHDLGVLADFAAGPPQTVPLILLRHAKARPKDGWKPADAARPLDDSGRYAAKALADLLTCFSPSFRVISSPAVRCLETLRPLSALTGDPVREEPSLYAYYKPGTGAPDAGTVNAALIREAIASGEPTVICAHRENLPALREAALAALAGYRAVSGEGPAGGVPRERVPGAPAAADGGPAASAFELPRDWDETLPTSGFWVLNIVPLPEAAEPAREREPDTTASHVTNLTNPDEQGRGRARWQRLRALFRRDAGAEFDGGTGGDLGGGGDGDDRVSGAGAGSASKQSMSTGGGPDSGAGSEARAPAGVLISADRYDLSDLAES